MFAVMGGQLQTGGREKEAEESALAVNEQKEDSIKITYDINRLDTA